MNQIREIVTKAVVAKGKKAIALKEEVFPEKRAFSILGCWIINHTFEARRKGSIVQLSGSFEANIWYSLDGNTKTEITRKTIKYDTEISTKQLVTDYIEDSDDILIRILEQPTCKNALINEEKMELEIKLEVIAEIIGETKMQVTVFDAVDTWDDEDDFENIIDQDFLKT